MALGPQTIREIEREELERSREIWANRENQRHHLRVHMAQLRHKLEPDPARPSLITTEPGVGYRLRDQS